MLKNLQELIASKEIELEALEYDRQEKLSAKKVKSRKVLIIGGIVLSVFLLISLLTSIFVFIVAVVIFLITWAVIMGLENNAISRFIKNELINSLVKTVDDSFKYKADSFIKAALFDNSQIIKSYTSITGEDYFSGIYNDIEIEFSELHVTQKNDKSTTTLFKGPFFAVKSNFNFEGHTTILPDNLEKNFGGIGRVFQKLNFARRKDTLLKIDHEIFEKYFAVYSKNEKQAVKTLNNELCDKLVSLVNEGTKKQKVYFAFSGEFFYLGLFNHKDIFPINYKDKITESSLHVYYNEFVDYLNLISEITAIINNSDIKKIEKSEIPVNKEHEGEEISTGSRFDTEKPEKKEKIKKEEIKSKKDSDSSSFLDIDESDNRFLNDDDNRFNY